MENKRTARMMKVERIHLTYCDVVVACLMNSIEVATNPGQRALQYWRPLFRQMIGDIGELVFGLGSENPAQRLLIVDPDIDATAPTRFTLGPASRRLIRQKCNIPRIY